MIRDFEIHEGKNAPAYLSAASACKTGMGVVMDRAAKTFDFPTSATADNIMVVHKARIPVGTDCAITDFSDYHEPFNTVAVGEFVPLWGYEGDEAFGTDQFNATNVKAANAGKYLAVGTDGKWDVAASGVDSVYRLVEMYNDAGHELAYIEVLKTPGSNS